MDEYEVADEHAANLLDIDNMGYEDLLALQERIGYVSKGLCMQQIEALPVCLFEDVHQRAVDEEPAEEEKRNVPGRTLRREFEKAPGCGKDTTLLSPKL